MNSLLNQLCPPGALTVTRPEALQLLRRVVEGEVRQRISEQQPVDAAADKEFFEEEFLIEDQRVTRPPSFNRGGRLGPWLSRRDGSATGVSRCVYIILLFYSVAWLFLGVDGTGLFNKLGCRRVKFDISSATQHNLAGECDLDTAESWAAVATHIGAFFMLFAVLAAFHALRLVHRSADAGGELALLGADTALVSIASAKLLRQRAKWTKGFGLWLVLQGALGLVAVATLIDGVPLIMRLLLPVWVVCWTLTVWSVCAWFLSLVLAAALCEARVQAVAAAVEAATSHRQRLDDHVWRLTIEQPAVALATEVLPHLSKGWGHSVALVGLGFVCLTTGLGAVLYEVAGEWLSAGNTVGQLVWALCAALVGGLAFLPVLLASAPTDVSTACDKLKEALILLRARDPCREHHRIGALYEVLQLVNKEQGVGFKVCGMVFNRRRLTELAFFLYTALATVVPILLGSRENTKTQGDNGSSIGS